MVEDTPDAVVWRGFWIEKGRDMEITFRSVDSFMIARVDFQLLVFDMCKKVPSYFRVEKVQHANPQQD